VEVIAPDRASAVKLFRSEYPDRTKGLINCSDIYTEAKFAESGMEEGNLGAFCHRVLCQEG